MVKTNILGGSYSSVQQANKGTNQEAHHLIAWSSYKGIMSKNIGPVIEMTKTDHQQTASWGRRKNAQNFQIKQRDLVLKGEATKALELGIADVQSKFGNKYNAHIQQAEAYWKQQNLSTKFKEQVSHLQTPSTNQKLAALKNTTVVNTVNAQIPKPLDTKLADIKTSNPKYSPNQPNSISKNTPKPSL